MTEILDDYGKQCFEAGKVAARMEGLPKAKCIAQMAIDNTLMNSSSVSCIPLHTEGGYKMLHFYIIKDQLIVVVV